MSEPVGTVALSNLPLLLVEDDDGDAVLLRACLADAGVPEGTVSWTRSLGDALAAVQSPAEPPGCILLDLGLPDTVGYDGVDRLVAAAPDVPVIVLTGRQERDGLSALAAGAQDYLAKDTLTAERLERSIRYAVERKRAQSAQQQLREMSLSAAEQARLERGLLPTPLLRSDLVSCATYYRPGRDDAVLGGDFFDVVETADGRVRAVIGDVMGHGPDEAAIGVHLRVAWRTLVLAGTPDDQVLPTLALLLHAETDSLSRFATACDITVEGTRMTVRVAGHPAPIVVDEQGGRYFEARIGLPLGVRFPGLPDEGWPATELELQPGTSVVLYTDGLLDTFVGLDTPGSIGIAELVDVVSRAAAAGGPAAQLIPTVLAGAPREPIDDTAAVVLTLSGPRG